MPGMCPGHCRDGCGPGDTQGQSQAVAPRKSPRPLHRAVGQSWVLPGERRASGQRGAAPSRGDPSLSSSGGSRLRTELVTFPSLPWAEITSCPHRLAWDVGSHLGLARGWRGEGQGAQGDGPGGTRRDPGRDTKGPSPSSCCPAGAAAVSQGIEATCAGSRGSTSPR